MRCWPSGQLTAKGKTKYQFHAPRGDRSGGSSRPCGRCLGCQCDRSQDWATRCVHESQLHEENCFITLTYAKEHLPKNGTLVKKHWQDFMKRLRKHRGKCRYFTGGEYGQPTPEEILNGDNLGRPHYHALLFGLDFPDKQFWNKNKQGDQLFQSASLDAIWGKGRVIIGALTFETAAYIARYTFKKVQGEHAPHWYGKKIPEFIVMSLKPGIGQQWFDKFQSDVYPSDFVVLRGRKIKPPKFYDRKLETLNPSLHSQLKDKRKLDAKAPVRQKENTYGRLRVRAQVKAAKLNSIKRSI